MTRRPLQDRRPFEDYIDQPDTAERKRLDMHRIPLALPKKREVGDARDPVR